MRFYGFYKLLAVALLLVQLYATEHALEHVFATPDGANDLCELCLTLSSVDHPVNASANSELYAAATRRDSTAPGKPCPQPLPAYLARAPPDYPG